ncbi:antiviral innate immune response receptor RIG-I-like [Haliotis cracherodii]|uniref:antiviral innate immune response receptor RIG-I-like n=1 Tax=Haliotis cracherodii TaxID=6455 RepID=UPI0039E86F1A
MAEVALEVPVRSARVNNTAFLVESVDIYREMIIRKVRCGSFIGHMCFPASFQKTIRDILENENQDKQVKATTIFLDYLKERRDPRDYMLFMQLLEQNGYDALAEFLKGETDLHKDGEHMRLMKFFVEDISNRIDVEALYPCLVQGNWLDEEDGKRLRNIAATTGRIPAARWLVLMILPRRKKNWLKQFLQLLRDNGFDELVEWIEGDGSYPGSADGSDSSEYETRSDDTVSMNNLSASGDAYSLKNNLDLIPDEDETKRPFTYLEKTGPRRGDVLGLPFKDLRMVDKWVEKTSDIPRDIDDASLVSSIEENALQDLNDHDFVSHELMETRANVFKPLENRPYQDELVNAVADGSNAIIIAPTGCGKTVVALRIMQEHLQKMQGRGKVAFFANEVTLVDQQHEMCKGHIEESVKTGMIVGETKDKSKIPLGDLIRQTDILFMTPQIIVDAIADKAIDSLSIFTLLVFDECHHVLSKHPTSKIMAIYIDLKLEGVTRLPQVVGLTASVGVGKKKEATLKKGATTHIRTLCSTMDATGGLVTVRKNKENLDEHTHFVETAIKKTNERSSDPFKQCVVGIMMKIEERMSSHESELGIGTEDEPLGGKFKSYAVGGTMQYHQWLYKLYYTVIPSIRNIDFRRSYITCVQHLVIYNNALFINEHCRARDGMLVIEKAFRDPLPNVGCDTEIWLNRLYTENWQKLEAESRTHVILNPRLILLRLEVLNQVCKKPTSRILILVKLRSLARALCRVLTEMAETKNLNPVIVTGCGAPGDKGGMTRPRQIEAVKSFKWGQSRVAVATSVAEEGIDITTCSLVIRYEYVSNEIGMIQARGRASRVEDGTYCLITGNSSLATREETNAQLEIVMNEAVDALQNEFDQDPISFRQSIEEIQRKQKLEREQNEQRSQKRPKNLATFRLHCYKCTEYICDSSDIRVVNSAHHMVMAPSIGKLITVKYNKTPVEFDGLKKYCKIHCKKCDLDWGVGMVYKDVKLVVLSMKGVMAYDRRGYQYHRKYWKDAPFDCSAMTERDMLNYTESF